MRILAKAYAKVNIGLRIMGQRPDGYHDLDSYFHLVDLHDEIDLSVEASSLTRVRISGNEGYIKEGQTDLMEKAARLFALEAGLAFDLEIAIDKRIPFQAGLGGGSSDASAVLCALEKAFGNPLGQERLMALSLAIGSDVPFFTSGLVAAHAQGRGEVLEAVDSAPGEVLIVMRPGDKVSTIEAFSRADARGGGRSPLPGWTTEKEAWQELYDNDFDFLQPILADRRYLAAVRNSVYHGTSGSGAAQLVVPSGGEDFGDLAVIRTALCE